MYEHPEIRPQIEVMKTEVMKYQVHADSIKSFEENKDRKGKDTFDLSDWWKSNCATLPSHTDYIQVSMQTQLQQTSTLVVDCLDQRGKGRNGWVQWGAWEATSSMKLPFGCVQVACGNPTRKWHIPRKEYIISVNNRLFITWSRHPFRNRLNRHLLQSIILSLSLIGADGIDYHFHLL